MNTLSLDPSHLEYRGSGVVALTGEWPRMTVVTCKIDRSGTPTPEGLVQAILPLFKEHGARCLVLASPASWKGMECEHQGSRCCDRLLNKPTKAGYPGAVVPRSSTRAAEFSIAVAQELIKRGFRPYEGVIEEDQSILLESFPLAAWKALGIRPLPSRENGGLLQIPSRMRQLRELMDIALPASLTHDQAQALVCGLAGAQLGATDISLVGAPPAEVDGTPREGFIALPVPPGGTAKRLACAGA